MSPPTDTARRVSKRRENRGRLIPSGKHTQPPFPESAVFFQSRLFFSRASCFFPESAVFETSRPFLERVTRRGRLATGRRCRPDACGQTTLDGPHLAWPNPE